jgi:tetratricopeptide (TPR) repeat protein
MSPDWQRAILGRVRAVSIDCRDMSIKWQSHASHTRRGMPRFAAPMVERDNWIRAADALAQEWPDDEGALTSGIQRSRPRWCGPAGLVEGRGLARDDRLAEAYAAQAYVQGMFDWDWAGAEATIQRAVRIEPNSVDAHYVYAILLMAMGRLSEALARIEQAAQLDPLSAHVQSTFGRILYRARRFDEAMERLNHAIELEPRNAVSVGRLADVYLQMARYDEALQTFDKARALTSTPATSYRARIALTYARMGRADDARRLLPNLQSPAGGPAAVHTALGDFDAAFTLLFRAVEEREDWFLFIKADPDFDALHADHRWNELLQRMRLASK